MGNHSSAALGRMPSHAQQRRVSVNQGFRYHDRGRNRILRLHSECALVHGSRWSKEGNRGRHCFVYRSSKPAQDNFPCCCPKSSRFINQIATFPCVYSVACSPPVSRLPSIAGPPECCCPTQSFENPMMRCCCTLTKTPKFCCFSGPTSAKLSPVSTRPIIDTTNAGCEKQSNLYFRNSTVYPVANFDLPRYDRDETRREENRQRRNVSVRTCVDYDYEPRAELEPRIPSTVPNPRAVAAPLYIPNYPPESAMLRDACGCYDARCVQSDHSILRNFRRKNYEYKFITCPYQ
ncbi:uncharacterized protein [Drosophila tropicalis]|uniref:uncharacterized protein n=1 Tax=Drosophila tropicalis TaxID=46794 RepID=UPI0035AC01F6